MEKYYDHVYKFFSSPDVCSKFVPLDSMEIGAMSGLGLSEPIGIRIPSTVASRVLGKESSSSAEGPGPEKFSHGAVVVLKLPPGHMYNKSVKPWTI